MTSPRKCHGCVLVPRNRPTLSTFLPPPMTGLSIVPVGDRVNRDNNHAGCLHVPPKQDHVWSDLGYTHTRNPTLVSVHDASPPTNVHNSPRYYLCYCSRPVPENETVPTKEWKRNGVSSVGRSETGSALLCPATGTTTPTGRAAIIIYVLPREDSPKLFDEIPIPSCS